jgi:hypothetical protein
LLHDLDHHQERQYSFAEIHHLYLSLSDYGCRVRIHSIVSNQALNDKQGVVEHPLQIGKERVGVKVERSGTSEPMLFKASNLEVVDPRLSVKLNGGQKMIIKVHQGFPVIMQPTTLRPPSAGCLHSCDLHVTWLLNGLLWHCNIVTGKLPAPFDPSHVQKLRETADGKQVLLTLAEGCVSNWQKVLASFCCWAKSRPQEKEPLPFASDLRENTDVTYWPQTSVSGIFWVCKQNKDGALLIHKGNEVNGAIFCVLGLTSSICSLNPVNALPFAISATLLPYRGRIIHDNLAQALPDGPCRYPSQSMAKVLHHRVALETPVYSLPNVPYGKTPVTAFDFAGVQ